MKGLVGIQSRHLRLLLVRLRYLLDGKLVALDGSFGGRIRVEHSDQLLDFGFDVDESCFGLVVDMG